MKSHDLKKALCQWTAMLALVVSGAVWAANGVDFSQSPEVSGTQEGAIRMPKEQERMPLNYVNQPPMIPHSVEGYQVTTNTNRCLQCHGVESYRTTGAPRISPTHFMDSDGKVGAEVEEGHDFIRITPPATLQFADIATYNDHRMAMCFSLVALSDTPVTILDPKCTAKTFPDYFEQLARISTSA